MRSHLPLPNFLIIGAMKAGTTSLHRYLSAHPEVFMSEPKELHFFSGEYVGPPRDFIADSPSNLHRGLDWYRSRFAGVRGERAIGEATPKYTRWPAYSGTPERIARAIPHARLIYVVRNPIDRMRSHYLHYVSTGHERRPIDRAFREDPIYTDASRYAAQIDQYLKFFDRAQFLVLTSDDLRDAERETYIKVLRFLMVDETLAPAELPPPSGRTVDKRKGNLQLRMLRRVPMQNAVPNRVRLAVRNAVSTPVTDHAAELSDDLRTRLAEVFAEDAMRLRTFLGEDFDAWGLPRNGH